MVPQLPGTEAAVTGEGSEAQERVEGGANDDTFSEYSADLADGVPLGRPMLITQPKVLAGLPGLVASRMS